MFKRTRCENVATRAGVGARPPTSRVGLLLVMSGAGCVVGITPVAAQSSPSPVTQEAARASIAPACAAPEFRQFDFWVGRWEVRDASGRVLGTNTIEMVNRGCGLREQWSGTSGSIGTSVNAYDAGRKQWHQTWIDSDGLLLVLTGQFRDGAMTMSGEVVAPDGKRTANRIRWYPAPERGTIRQTWEQSTDGGRTWTTAFDGFYFER